MTCPDCDLPMKKKSSYKEHVWNPRIQCYEEVTVAIYKCDNNHRQERIRREG